MLIIALLYLMSCASSSVMLHAFFIADVNNLRSLFVDSPEIIQTLLWVGVIASRGSIVPILTVEFGMIPCLWRDGDRM